MDDQERYIAIQVMMMPKDAGPALPADRQNAPNLTIFGGILLSYIDQAGAIGARREVVAKGGESPKVVTVAIHRVEFHQPVEVGDVVRFMTSVVKMGRTSITMHVWVEALRDTEMIAVTEAELVYVGLDRETGKPRPLLPE